MPTMLRRAARPTVLGLAAALCVLLAVPAEAAQPSSWGSPDAGPGRSRAITFSALKAATIGSYAEAWRATLPPTTVTDCAGRQSGAAGDDTVAVGSTLIQHQGPVLRAYNATSGAVLWTVDTRKAVTDRSAFWRITATPTGVYVYQSTCTGARTGMVTRLDLGNGARLARRAGLGYGAGTTFAVSGGVVLTPEKALDATTLTDRWDVPQVSGYRSTLLAASADTGVFSVGGDVLRLIQARRLSDGTLLWERAGTPSAAAYSSDDAWLLLQSGSQVDVAFPASGVNNFSLRGVQLLSASATDLIVLRGTGLERYSWTGSQTVGPQDGARVTAIAGKLLFDSRGPYSPGRTGLGVLNATTLTPVATVAATLRVEKVIPIGNRLAVTTLTAAGQRDGGVVVLTAPA